MYEENRAKWERILDPEVLRPNLIMASLYIITFEILKNSTIIKRIKDLYFIGYDKNGEIISEEYKTDVLSKGKGEFFASLNWLKYHNVIDNNDIERINNVRELRNLLAHETIKLMMDGLPPNFPELFSDMFDLLNRIEKWWIINFDIPANPDMENKQVDIIEDDIVPGPIVGIQMLIDVALGSDQEANSYINELKKHLSTS